MSKDTKQTACPYENPSLGRNQQLQLLRRAILIQFSLENKLVFVKYSWYIFDPSLSLEDQEETNTVFYLQREVAS